MMTERIAKNEERLDKAAESIRKLHVALEQFRANRKDIALLERYYGSKNWFRDKEAYERQEIPQIKAGVLGEDAVWDLLDDVDDIIKQMKAIVRSYGK